VGELLDSGNLSEWHNGPTARRFAEAWALYHGQTFHAVAVNSGTSALHVALEAGGVGPGDEVIVPAICFVAAPAAVVTLGATPIICDVEPHSLMLDVEQAESLIGLRTKAILPVHFWGYPADAPALRRLCDEHGLLLVEDTAQAPGAPIGDGKAGTWGDFATFSFANRKHVTCGEGGMAITRSAEVAARMQVLANCGKGIGWDDYQSNGYSYRMVEFSALVGLDGLTRLDDEIAARQQAADVYREALADTALEPLPVPPWGDSVYFKLPILMPEDRRDQRAFLVDAIDAENVSCRVPHRPLYSIPWLAAYLRERDAYRGAEDCPVTAAMHPRLFEVETGPNLPLNEARVSARAVEKVWKRVETRG
jgi:perosamine synthetase